MNGQSLIIERRPGHAPALENAPTVDNVKNAWFHPLLEHPLTRGLDVNDPRRTNLRRQIIAQKPFLRRIYQEWYEMLALQIPAGDGKILELGSGAGFLPQRLPDVITSDILPCDDLNLVLDGQLLPFADASLKAIVMVDVMHHLPRIRQFFSESARCIRSGGVIAAVEPWLTPWSQFVYSQLHFEPFDPGAQWEFPPTGPLSGANGALPWIIFHRDRAKFAAEFPQWKIRRIQVFMPFRLLVCGGVSFRNLMPSFTFKLWRGLENLLTPLKNQLGMLAFIVLERK